MQFVDVSVPAGGMSKVELLPPEGTADKVMLDIAFCCSDMDGTTRILDAADEETVEDVNLYLYHRQSGACFDDMSEAPLLSGCGCPKGNTIFT